MINPFNRQIQCFKIFAQYSTMELEIENYIHVTIYFTIQMWFVWCTVKVFVVLLNIICVMFGDPSPSNFQASSLTSRNETPIYRSKLVKFFGELFSQSYYITCNCLIRVFSIQSTVNDLAVSILYW